MLNIKMVIDTILKTALEIEFIDIIVKIIQITAIIPET